MLAATGRTARASLAGAASVYASSASSTASLVLVAVSLSHATRRGGSKCVRSGSQGMLCRSCSSRLDTPRQVPRQQAHLPQRQQQRDQRRNVTTTRATAASAAAISSRASALVASSPPSWSPLDKVRFPAPAGLAPLASTRRLLSVAGPDAAKFLHGIVSASVLVDGDRPELGLATHRGDRGPVDSGESNEQGFYTTFLNAHGRILFDVFIYLDPTKAAHGDAFLIEVDVAQADALARHLRRYKLRAKFAVRVVPPEERSVWFAWDDIGGGSEIGSALKTLAREGKGQGIIVLDDRRAPGLGWRILGPSATVLDSIGKVLPAVPETAYRIRRYLAGVAEGQAELPFEHSLPHEANLDAMPSAGPPVDFHKGCYVGQELTIRTEHRGVVRKRVLPVVLYHNTPGGADAADAGHGIPRELHFVSVAGGSPDGLFSRAETIPPDTNISLAPPGDTGDGANLRKGRPVGKWLAGYGNVGLAVCRLEAMTDVMLPGEAATKGYNLGDEFVMAWDEDGADGTKSSSSVRVKAFVPPWLRVRLDAQAAGKGHS